MTNYRVNNWSQEIHVLTAYIDFEHIKGKSKCFSFLSQDLHQLSGIQALI